MSDQDLREKEDAAVLDETAKDFSPQEQAEFGKLAENDQVGEGYKNEKPVGKLRGAASNLSTYRKLGIAGGVVGIFAVIAIAIFSFLLPFKLTHIVETIEQRVGNVPGYAVENRLEFYMSRYLMIRTLEATAGEDFDFSPGSPDRDRFAYLGDSFFDTMYTNWKGAKLELKLADTYGIKLTATVNPDLITRSSKLKANQFRIDELSGRNASLESGPLNRTEVRDLIKKFAREETRSRQVFKRYNMRKMMKKYYGVGNWKPFERQIDAGANRYYEKKRALQKRLVNETVGRLSERYSSYMTCLLQATTSRACRDILKKADTSTGLSDADKEESGIEDVEDAVDDTPVPDVGSDNAENKRLARRLTEKIQEFGLKKTMTLIAGPLAVIEFVDTFSKFESSLESGVLNQVVYDKNAQQYLAYAAPILSAADQIKSGEDFDLDDVRSAQEVFTNYDESPVYQLGTGASGTVSALDTVHRDCNGKEADGNETALDSGETVCPEKRLVQDKTSFTDSAGWSALDAVFDGYRAGPIDNILNFVSGLTSGLADITGLDSVIQKLTEISGFDDFLANAFASLLNRVAGPVISGSEVGGDAYDSMFAAVAVQQSSVGGDVGVAKEDTIGGAYLSDAQVAVIRDQQMADYYKELENKSFLARYFSPSVKESLTGQLALNMPTTGVAASQQIASALGNPSGIFGTLVRAFSPKASAQINAETNPFHAVNMGFPVDHEVFTAEGGEGMDYDQINAKYHCDQEVSQRSQNQAFDTPDNLPFEVPTQVDPCLLEEAVVDASTRYFTGSFDEGITGETSQNTTSAAGATVAGDPTTESESVQCATSTKDLGVHEGFNDGNPIPTRLCAIPTILSDSKESNPGNEFYIPGADGKLIVNSRVSGAVLAMSQAAANGGVVMRAESGFRSNEHQRDLWISLGQNTSFVARPGFSNHQSGAAIDFTLSNGTKKFGATCTSPAQSLGDPTWEWLKGNAPRYGFGQYAVESWHWDASTSDRICR